MSKIKLLTLTSRNYMLAFAALFALFFGVFYVILRMEVKHNIDEILFNRKNNIIKILESKRSNLEPDSFSFTDFKISPTDTPIEDTYADTLIYEATDKEYDEYRKLVSTFHYNNKLYKLEIVKAHLETGEIVHTVLMSLGLIFLFMIGMFYFTTLYFSKKAWKPFYNTLSKLKNFEPEKSERILLNESKIDEFNELNWSLTELADRVRHSFTSQKQFIENASHEMQTPLAIIQNQLELLIADPGLTEFQSQKITRILDSTQRITKLNNALQLISKIENSQFIDSEKCNVKSIVENVLTYFDGQQEKLKINVELNLADVTVDANGTLLDVLITNLIKNAFLHNIENGNVRIKLSGNCFEIMNTSSNSELPKEKLFQRFFKQGQNKESWGLGLAISKRICELNKWSLQYTSDAMTHTFALRFDKA